MTLEPFDLERALAGEPVCTREGREVTQVTLFNADTNYPVFGVVSDSIVTWNKEGVYQENSKTHLDLFMKPKIAEMFYNVYFSDGEVSVGTMGYRSEDAAKKGRNQYKHYVKTIKVTNELT